MALPSHWIFLSSPWTAMDIHGNTYKEPLDGCGQPREWLQASKKSALHIYSDPFAGNYGSIRYLETVAGGDQTMSNVPDMNAMSRMLQGLSDARRIQRPKTGWLRLCRKHAGLSAGEVARRMGLSRHLPLQFERNEITDRITLRSLRSMADAMGYDFVYGLIPKQNPATPALVAAHTEPPARTSLPGSKKAASHSIQSLFRITQSLE
jgi:transcriptional regulator with XRE-family HTH domain